MCGVEKPESKNREWVLYLDVSVSFAQLSPSFVLTKQNGVYCLITEVAE